MGVKKSPLPETVLVLGDVHIPFHDERALALALKVNKLLKPSLTVQIGDWGDQHFASRHSRRPGEPAPNKKAELSRITEETARLEGSTYGSLLMVEGNHCIRMHLRALDKDPDNAEYVPTIRELYGMSDEVQTSDYGDPVHMGHVAFVHDLASDTRKTLSAAGQCVVVGHGHRLEIIYGGDLGEGKHFAMQVGWLGNPSHKVFSYAKSSTRRQWMLGLGWLRRIGNVYVATPIPMIDYTVYIEGRVITL